MTTAEALDVVDDYATIVNNRPVVSYSRTEAGLAALRAELAGKTYDLKTVKGNDEARGDRLRCVTLRTTLEKTRTALKAPALEFGKRIDDEAKRITAEIVALETPIDAAIKADEERRAAEKAERVRIEVERVAKHQQAIATIRGYVGLANAPGMTAAKLTRGMVALQEMVFGEAFEEFADQAAAARDETLAALQVLHDAAAAREAEAAERERQRIENERQAAENRRVAAELAEQQRKIDEARAALERQQREAAEAQRRADEEAQARERAEHARLEAERIAELTKDAPKPGDDDPIDAPALVVDQSTTPPGEAGGQVDGCRAPESHPDGCSGPVPQDQTSLPASPSVDTYLPPTAAAVPAPKPVPEDCLIVHGEVCIATGPLSQRLGFVISSERLKELGFTALIVSVFMSTGLILFSMGIIGEYLNRLFALQHRKPPYLIQEVLK